jgi:GNAT superfamily N-acetyltransferase
MTKEAFMEVTIVSGLEHPEEIVALFSEYTQMLVEVEPSFAGYLEQQNYQHEIEDLPYKYGPQVGGVLHLALVDGKPVGCIGLRKLDDTRCEMKRLYVLLEYRKNKLGDRLVQHILQDARELGYKQMLLDTLPQLDSAIRLYQRHGFDFIPCYNDSPVESTLFMGKDL